MPRRAAQMLIALIVAMLTTAIGPGDTADALPLGAQRSSAVSFGGTQPTAPSSDDQSGDRLGDTAPTTEPPTGSGSSPGQGNEGVDQSVPTQPATSEPIDPEVDDTTVDDDGGTSGSDDSVSLRPGTSPQIGTSTIPLASALLAALILGGVGIVSVTLARRSRARRASMRRPPVVEAPLLSTPGSVPIVDREEDRAGSETATVSFLLGLGESLIDAGDSVSHIEAALRTIARVNGVGEVGVIVLPTALMLSVRNGRHIETEVSTAGRTALRLDQVDDILSLVDDAERGEVDAAEGQRRLAAIHSSDPPFDRKLALLGYVLTTVGLALVLNAAWPEVLVAAVLGVIIGSFRLSTNQLGTSYQPFLPLIAATTISVTVFALARIIDDLATFPLLVAPLVTFLPGAVLTMGVLELATGQIIAGASRLASGAMQLVLLALGIIAGAQLLGIPAGDLDGDVDGTVAVLAPWLGVGVFGIGVVWFNGARASARVWILLVLYVAFAGQVLGGLFFGSALSAFFGAVAMTPVAILASRQSGGPTPLVLFLPGFWILVPGALGLEGVARLLGENGGAGVSTVVTTVTSMVGISLGILLGLIATTSDPENPWVEVDTPR